jgi:hypothetical protein
MTDGMENASHEFYHAKITSLIKVRQDAGWLVVFLGEGIDVAKQGEAMGAAKASVAAYLGGKGLRAAGGVVPRATARYAAMSGDVRQARDKARGTRRARLVSVAKREMARKIGGSSLRERHPPSRISVPSLRLAAVLAPEYPGGA